MTREEWKQLYRRIRKARDRKQERVTGFLRHNGMEYIATLGDGFAHDTRKPARAGKGLILTQSLISERPIRARFHSEVEWVWVERATALVRTPRAIDIKAYLRGIEYLRFIRADVERLRTAA
jgi:hypothetical protein